MLYYSCQGLKDKKSVLLLSISFWKFNLISLGFLLWVNRNEKLKQASFKVSVSRRGLEILHLTLRGEAINTTKILHTNILHIQPSFRQIVYYKKYRKNSLKTFIRFQTDFSGYFHVSDSKVSNNI